MKPPKATLAFNIRKIEVGYLIMQTLEAPDGEVLSLKRMAVVSPDDCQKYFNEWIAVSSVNTPDVDIDMDAFLSNIDRSRAE